MLLDRGFQVFNTGYPEAARVFDNSRLGLRPFAPGALMRHGERLHRLGDPRRLPRWAISTLRAPIGSPADKARLALLLTRAVLAPAGSLLSRPETTAVAALRAAGLSELVIDRLMRPFLSGVFLEDELVTSSRFLDLVLRSLGRGTQCVPAGGMGQLPEQLATGLTVEVGVEVKQVQAGIARTADGQFRSGVVVIATSAPQAAGLLPGLTVPAMRSVVTHYHLAPVPPVAEAAIVVDGEGGGPVANTVVLTNAAPSYAPGRVLVASSVVRGDPAEPVVRTHLSRIYGCDTSEWRHVARYDITAALPDMRQPMHQFRRSVRIAPGLYVCGDHRDSGSIQGALVSGRRAAEAVLADRL
ncbi:MAG: NAD(P)/FAD-dependent oxidoreductase [Mycobacteriales bacterium]